MKQIVVSVDRLERATVILEAENGQLFTADVKLFRESPVEGTLYRVPLEANGTPRWFDAIADVGSTAKRKADLHGRMGKLSSGDRGGDITL